MEELIMARNKVEICGVNTSSLPLLSNEEKEALFEVEQLPTGERYLGHPNLNKTSCIVEGKTYTSNGSYCYELLNEDETRVYALAEVVRRMLEQK